MIWGSFYCDHQAEQLHWWKKNSSRHITRLVKTRELIPLISGNWIHFAVIDDSLITSSNSHQLSWCATQWRPRLCTLNRTQYYSETTRVETGEEWSVSYSVGRYPPSSCIEHVFELEVRGALWKFDIGVEFFTLTSSNVNPPFGVKQEILFRLFVNSRLSDLWLLRFIVFSIYFN